MEGSLAEVDISAMFGKAEKSDTKKSEFQYLSQ